MSRDLQVRIAVHDDDRPVVEALRRLNRDIGSIEARRVLTNAPAELRFLCVAVVDRLDVQKLLASLVVELGSVITNEWETLDEICLMPMPLDAVLVVFTRIIVMEA